MNDARYSGHDRRRGNQILEGRIEDLERDVLALKSNVDGLKEKVTSVERAIVANTQLTEGVKRDTEELVTLVRGSKLAGRLIAWGAPIGAAVVAILAYLKGVRL